MIIDENYEFLGQIFIFLIKNNTFKEKFKIFAPELANDIESATINPTCTCKNKIINYVSQNKNKCYLLFRDFININPGIFDLNEFLSFVNPPKNYSGKVEKVKISEWENFVKKIINERATFHSFSTSKINDEYINVFFI